MIKFELRKVLVTQSKIRFSPYQCYVPVAMGLMKLSFELQQGLKESVTTFIYEWMITTLSEKSSEIYKSWWPQIEL